MATMNTVKQAARAQRPLINYLRAFNKTFVFACDLKPLYIIYETILMIVLKQQLIQENEVPNTSRHISFEEKRGKGRPRRTYLDHDHVPS